MIRTVMFWSLLAGLISLAEAVDPDGGHRRPIELGPNGVRVKSVESGLFATDWGSGMTEPAGCEMLGESRQMLTAAATR